ncbi:thiamine phosphate synthase [Chitinophaga lutea]|uniref:Thiamine phosphate synthase n=1 Tax=Chitinophaga lutea TaxID=2488634 RepID=A0A3N4Q2Y8_9BACT|nr:thiamine phosphate synthase [Chitinophaga lutea]RPE13559.1 thiamine phosphate synthase [Chitinophaga lutea]
MIWIVTSPERIHEEHLYLNELAAAGPVTLLLRKPGWSLEAYTGLLDRLHDHSRVMVAGFPELLQRYNVMGLHVGEAVRRTDNSRTVPSAGTPHRQASQAPVFSTSIHTPGAPAGPWNYLLLGPVFDSISKNGYSGKGHLFVAVPPNCIAIGGVQADNIRQVKSMGFCGAALLGTIWSNPAGAVKTYQTIQDLWQHS